VRDNDSCTTIWVMKLRDPNPFLNNMGFLYL